MSSYCGYLDQLFPATFDYENYLCTFSFDQVEMFLLVHAMGVYLDTHALKIRACGTKTDLYDL